MLLGFVVAFATEMVEMEYYSSSKMQLISCGEQGFVVGHRSRDRRQLYELDSYSTSLARQNSQSIAFERTHELRAFAHDEDHCWILMNRVKSSTLVKVDLNEGTHQRAEFSFSAKATPHLLTVDGVGGAYISGRRRSGVGVLTYVSGAGEVKEVPVQSKQFVNSLPRSSQGRVQAVLMKRWRKQDEHLQVLTLENGTVVSNREISAPEEVILRSAVLFAPQEEGATTNRADGDQGRGTVVGTYSQAHGPKEGIYLLGFGPDHSWFRTIDYSNLDNGLAFLSESAEQRMQKKLEKKERKGKNTLRWNLLFHEPVHTSRGEVLVGEAYYPVYTTVATTTLVSDGKGGTTTKTVYVTQFSHWTFSHALVIGIDERGNRLWDQSFKLGIRGYPSEQHVRLVQHNDSIVLVYPQKGDLRTAVLADGEIISDEIVQIPGEAVKKNLHTNAVFWYADQFLLFGVNKKTDSKSKTFFVIKRGGEAKPSPSPLR